MTVCCTCAQHNELDVMSDDEELDEIFANGSDDQIIAELHQMQIHAARAKAFGELLCRFKYLMIIALSSLYVYYFHWSLLVGADTTTVRPADIAAVLSMQCAHRQRNTPRCHYSCGCCSLGNGSYCGSGGVSGYVVNSPLVPDLLCSTT